MSTQRGNLQKKGQKYKNATVFKNDKYQSNKRMEKLNELVVTNVCERCKNTIEWKIKYKKYKPLTCPQKCVKCMEKCVKYAYHMVCTKCALKEEICAKCGQNEPIAIKADASESDKQKEESDLKEQLMGMSLRERRAFLRQMDRESKQKDGPTAATNEKVADQIDSDDDNSNDDYDGTDNDSTVE